MNRLTKSVAITSFVVVALSYVVNAMDRQVFSVLVPGIRSDFGFSLSQGGLLATFFTLGIGIAGVPTGYLLDRLSRKAVILIGIAIYSAFTILTTISTGFGDMLTYRAFSGVGEAMQNGALFAAVGAYFFANRAMALGALNCAYGIGGYIGPKLGSHLSHGGTDWKIPFWSFGVVGFVFIGIVALVIRKSFTERKEIAIPVGPLLKVDNVPKGLYNRNVILLAVAGVVVGLSMYGYIGLYPTFLETQLHFGNGQAAQAASMFGLGAILGIPAGWLGDRFNSRNVMIVAALAGCVVGYLLFNGPTGSGWQYLLSFLEGTFASGFLFVNIYSSMQRSVRPHMIGRVSGIFVASFYLPAAFSGYIFADIKNATSWGGAGLWQLTIMPLIGVVALLFVKTGQMARKTSAAASDASLSGAEGI